ncbi:MAG: hypothetical protein Q8940_20875, partial [Bacteroidota bacterium]|nr:hypothetical protein [Bacteroidota bacterium]
SISPMGKQDITGEQLQQLKMESNLNSILDLDKSRIKVTLVDVEKIDGKDAYKLEMTPPLGNKWFEYYDKDSGLKVRQVKTVTSTTGQPIMQTIDFSDYRVVNGLKYPFKMSQSFGQQKIDMSVSSIKVNMNLEDNLFDPENK